MQELRSTGVKEYQMSGNSIIIMQVPVKVVIMNRHCNTGVIVIQSGVTTSGQMRQYQVIAYVKYQVIACQLSSIKYQVSGVK